MKNARAVLVTSLFVGCAAEPPPAPDVGRSRAPSTVTSSSATSVAASSSASAAPKKWSPPDCGPANTYYMVDCEPATDPSCGPQKMKPVLCPK